MGHTKKTASTNSLPEVSSYACVGVGGVEVGVLLRQVSVRVLQASSAW